MIWVYFPKILTVVIYGVLSAMSLNPYLVNPGGGQPLHISEDEDTLSQETQSFQ